MVLSARELQAACFELEVFVGNRAVGIIERRAEQFSFQYYPKVDQADFVSLLMPVRNQPYFALQAGRLPPVFDMNLPEGSLRRMLETRYSKVVSGFNDLALLALVGRNTLGRLGFGVPRAQDAPKLTLGALVNCADDDALLAQLYAGDAFFSGVAGVQPKALASVDDGAIEKFSDASAPGQDLKATFRGERLIIKAGGAHTPWIAANEFYCLRAAHLSGLVVPLTYWEHGRAHGLGRAIKGEGDGRN